MRPRSLAAHFAAERNALQRQINREVKRLFGGRFLTVHNRVERIIEETAELAQAEDWDVEEAVRIFRLAFAGTKGEPEQEVGGLQVCVLSYCQVKGFCADELEVRELTRLTNKTPEEMAAKLADKLRSGIVTDEAA